MCVKDNGKEGDSRMNTQKKIVVGDGAEKKQVSGLEEDKGSARTVFRSFEREKCCSRASKNQFK